MSGSPSNRLAPERLASSWAKLDRAKGHVDDFRRAVVEACDGEPRVLRTRREFDPETEQVLFIADEMPTVGDDWGLMIGDAVYNLRCALDHLWWQLAIDHLRREPSEKEAPDIQFPIISDPDRWSGHRFLKHIDGEAVEKAKSLQAYDRPEGAEPLLAALADLTNHDKHRKIRPAFFVKAGTGFATFPSDDSLIDCRLPSDGEVTDEGETVWHMTVDFGTTGLGGVQAEAKIGDVMLGMQIVPTGPNPDIEMEPQIRLDIALGEGAHTFGLLDHLGRVIWRVLNEFAPLLRQPDRG